MTTDVKLLPLPEPYGYLRDLDGGLQMSIGPVRPADRAGGYATPWAAMYDSGRVRANVAHATAPLQAEIEALRAEVGKWEVPCREWLDKTEWVQQTAKVGELGLHRADVLRQRIEQAEARAERLAEAVRYAVEQVPELATVPGIAAALDQEGGNG